jgi:organic hydroperoxide reductase OsmC/OhrA
MSVVKAMRFPASVQWRGDRLTRASAPGKPALDVATLPEFKRGIAGIWSPEELIVASAASCLALTLAAVSEASGVEIETIEVEGLGHVERGPDGRFQFVAIELTLAVEAAAEDPTTVKRLADDAERLCIVSAALDAPVHVRLVLPSPFGVALSG